MAHVNLCIEQLDASNVDRLEDDNVILLVGVYLKEASEKMVQEVFVLPIVDGLEIRKEEAFSTPLRIVCEARYYVLKDVVDFVVQVAPKIEGLDIESI